MVRERTKTEDYSLIPEGEYLFTVSKEVEKRKTEKGKTFYIFRFRVAVLPNGPMTNHTEIRMRWMVADMLRALKCEEVKENEFEWDTEEVVNRQVYAQIVHEPDYKDNSKKRARMTKIRAVDEKIDETNSQGGENEGENEEPIPF